MLCLLQICYYLYYHYDSRYFTVVLDVMFYLVTYNILLVCLASPQLIQPTNPLRDEFRPLGRSIFIESDTTTWSISLPEPWLCRLLFANLYTSSAEQANTTQPRPWSHYRRFSTQVYHFDVSNLAQLVVQCKRFSI